MTVFWEGTGQQRLHDMAHGFLFGNKKVGTIPPGQTWKTDTDLFHDFRVYDAAMDFRVTVSVHQGDKTSMLTTHTTRTELGPNVKYTAYPYWLPGEVSELAEGGIHADQSEVGSPLMVTRNGVLTLEIRAYNSKNEL